MPDLRVVLIGGTSHVGKSTVAREVAERLGFELMSTDGFARHPGRPWRTDGSEVPRHVAEHYGNLTVDELMSSVLSHYERLWPQIEALVQERAAESRDGLVLEGSALWPEWAAELRAPNAGSVWLAADAALVRGRIRVAAGYDQAAETERLLVEKFLARTLRYQALMTDAVERLGLARISVGEGRSVASVSNGVLESIAGQLSTAQHGGREG